MTQQDDPLLRERLTQPGARALQLQLLHYRHFRQRHEHANLRQQVAALEHWQSERLRHCHQDLAHANPANRAALDFLTNELYRPSQYRSRDHDIERVFPFLVSLLPDRLIQTIADVIALNHLTQELDHALLERLRQLQPAFREQLSEAEYSAAYLAAGRADDRRRQLQMAVRLGESLVGVVRSKALLLALTVSRRPARRKGLDALHDFLHRGVSAFRAIHDPAHLLATIESRESHYMDLIFAGERRPFGLPQA